MTCVLFLASSVREFRGEPSEIGVMLGERQLRLADTPGGGTVQMKAIVQDTYGSVDVLELVDVARPVAGDDACSSAWARPAFTSATGT